MLFSNRLSVVFTLLLFSALLGCRTAEEVTRQELPEESAVVEKTPLEMMFDTSKVFSDNFTGFMLYDPSSDSVIYAQNEKRYFTPASNTKLFTFYTGLKMLPDSVPALQYAVRGDSLIFRGTGAPSFLHPDFGTPEIYEFLKEGDRQLFYTDAHFDDELLGPGWSWSDFNYYYSAQKSPFPIYGNVMRVTLEEVRLRQIASDSSGLKVSPSFFQNRIDTPIFRDDGPLIARGFADNDYKYFPKADTSTYTVDRPFHYSPELITEMLSDTLDKAVGYLTNRLPEEDEYQTLYSLPADTLYKRMLQPSDNFIAEQLLLVTASHMGWPLNGREVIEYMKENHLQEMPEEPQWVDGSGLSRYNMFSPRSVIWLLQQIDREFEDDRELFAMLPAGGESGTIRSWYGSDGNGGEPFVFAKTGTLSNNHCLSGYLITDSGRKLLFSFMNNHYVTSSSVVKEEMNKVLQYLRKNF